MATRMLNAQHAQKTAGWLRDRLAHTYSIVARDPCGGEMGAAVQSHWFCVGALVPWAEAGVGVVVTQAMVNPSFGSRGLALLRNGVAAPEALKHVLETDEGRELRQAAVVDVHGQAAAWTGSRCIAEAGHHVGAGFSVQANMMLNDRVWPAMAEAFETSSGPLPERLLTALEAAEAAGGDVRGRQSAALLVVRGQPSGRPWEDRLVDLRVDDHAEPLEEIRRLLRVHRAYERMNQGDLAMERNDVDGALAAYRAAEGMFPDNLEMRYWHAVSLANVGRWDDALAIFAEVFRHDPNWRELTRRLPRAGLLEVSDRDLEILLSI